MLSQPNNSTTRPHILGVDTSEWEKAFKLPQFGLEVGFEATEDHHKVYIGMWGQAMLLPVFNNTARRYLPRVQYLDSFSMSNMS